MLVNGNQADGLCARRIAKDRGDPRLWQAKPLWPGLFCLHQLAVIGPIGEFTCDAPFLVGPLVDGQNAPAFGPGAVNAQHLQRVRANLADQPRLIGVVRGGHFGQTCQNTVARPQSLVALAGNEQNARGGIVACPFRRRGKLITLRIRCQDGQNRHRRQLIRLAVAAPFAHQSDVGFKFLQQAFQFNLCVTFDGKGFGNIAFRHQAGVFRHPLADLVFCGELGHALPLTRGGRREKTRRVMWAGNLSIWAKKKP